MNVIKVWLWMKGPKRAWTFQCPQCRDGGHYTNKGWDSRPEWHDGHLTRLAKWVLT